MGPKALSPGCQGRSFRPSSTDDEAEDIQPILWMEILRFQKTEGVISSCFPVRAVLSVMSHAMLSASHPDLHTVLPAFTATVPRLFPSSLALRETSAYRGDL